MKALYFLIIPLLVISTMSMGQTRNNLSFFGVRAGYLQASTQLTASRPNNNLRGIGPRNSFYGGVFYQHTLSRWIAYRVELNYQQKGIEYRDFDGNTLSQQRFHYAGISPLIGITPIAGLGIFVGPEANVFLSQSKKNGNPASIELGISGRVAYRYKWVGIEAGYFKSLNEYNHDDLGLTRFGFKNQTWQIGLIFAPTMLKTGKSIN